MSNEHLTYLYAGFNNAKFKLFYSSSATTVKWKARMIDFFISIIVGRVKRVKITKYFVIFRASDDFCCDNWGELQLSGREGVLTDLFPVKCEKNI